MNAKVGWEFPVDGGDQWQGFNDPGIEHFRGNPFGSLARELIQNSLDAPSGTPVIVSFELKEIGATEISSPAGIPTSAKPSRHTSLNSRRLLIARSFVEKSSSIRSLLR